MRQISPRVGIDLRVFRVAAQRLVGIVERAVELAFVAPNQQRGCCRARPRSGETDHFAVVADGAIEVALS